MKKLFSCLLLFGAGLCLSIAHAGTLTLVNHYGDPLVFTIYKGQNYLEGLQDSFPVMDDDFAIATHIGRSKEYCEPQSPETYIGVVGDGSDNGYFGVGRSCDKSDHRVDVNGYIGRGINYSWDDSDNTVIVFCTHKAYKANGGKCP